MNTTIEAPKKRKSKKDLETVRQERLLDLAAQRAVSERIDQIFEKTDPRVEQRRLEQKAAIEKQVASILEEKGVPEGVRVYGGDERGQYVDVIADRKATEWTKYDQAGRPPIEVSLVEELYPKTQKSVIAGRVYIMGRKIGGESIPKPLYHVGISPDKGGTFYVSHNSETDLNIISRMLQEVSRNMSDAVIPGGFIPSDIDVLRPIGTLLTDVIQLTLQDPQ